MRRLLLLALCAACSGPPKPQPPAPPAPPDAAESTEVVEEVPQEERIAAIEHAMNELAPVANQCWAAAAADDFHLAGDVRTLITVGRQVGDGITATAEITANSTGDEVLARCLSGVLARYPWAPVLHRQVIELPFHFDAPSMQNVIDRRFVPRSVQSGPRLKVLLDETNTGNAALSLIEIKDDASAKIPARQVERMEIWWIVHGSARVSSAGGKDLVLNPNDLLIVPVGAHIALQGDVLESFEALVAIVPGGREGSARAGALPGRSTTMAVRARPPQPTVRRAADAKHYTRPGGASWILVEAPAADGKLSVGFLEIDGGSVVPPHVHPAETEALYVVAGGGTMTIAGVSVPVTDESVVQIPAGVEHGFTAAAGGNTQAVQLYTPAGPEQRFKKPPAKPASRAIPTFGGEVIPGDEPLRRP